MLITKVTKLFIILRFYCVCLGDLLPCVGSGQAEVGRTLVTKELIHHVPLYVFSIQCHSDSELWLLRDGWKLVLKYNAWIPFFTQPCYSKHLCRVYRPDNMQEVWNEFRESRCLCNFRTVVEGPDVPQEVAGKVAREGRDLARRLWMIKEQHVNKKKPIHKSGYWNCPLTKYALSEVVVSWLTDTGSYNYSQISNNNH